MKYSIIVAVYNRLDEVKELIASAEELDFDRAAFELLFVDDGSRDGFQQYIAGYQSASGLNIRSLRQENRGPGAARNFGMENAKGRFFIFIDSDCMVPPLWLRAIDEAIADKELDAFGGRDTYHPSFPPILKAINYSMTSFIGTGGTRGNKLRIAKFYPRSFNMGIRREIFEKIGGMNDLRHGQDMDLSARIYEAGYKVGLIHDAYVYHKRRTSLPKFFRQIFNWGVARIHLSRLHKGLISPVHVLPSTLLVILLILLVLTPFTGWALPVWKTLAMLFAFVCLLAFLESLIKYKNIVAAVLSVITLCTQILAYGLGMIWAVIQVLLGREPRGFVRGYYGK